ncbi:MAG: hypothetical protein ACREC3_00440 [Methyloceanibacter sp.]
MCLEAFRIGGKVTAWHRQIPLAPNGKAFVAQYVQLAIRLDPGYGERDMSKCFFAVAVLVGTFSTGVIAGPVTQEESQYCAHDYRQYCNQDGLGSQLLALCMKDHGKELSPQCIKALEDAGEVTPEEKAELKKIGE